MVGRRFFGVVGEVGFGDGESVSSEGGFFGEGSSPEGGHGLGGAVWFSFLDHLFEFDSWVVEVRFPLTSGSNDDESATIGLAEHRFSDARIFGGIEVAGEAGDGGDEEGLFVFEFGDAFEVKFAMVFELPLVDESVAVDVPFGDFAVGEFGGEVVGGEVVGAGFIFFVPSGFVIEEEGDFSIRPGGWDDFVTGFFDFSVGAADGAGHGELLGGFLFEIGGDFFLVGFDVVGGADGDTADADFPIWVGDSGTIVFEFAVDSVFVVIPGGRADVVDVGRNVGVIAPHVFVEGVAIWDEASIGAAVAT